MPSMRGSRKFWFCQRRSNFHVFFFFWGGGGGVDEGRNDQDATTSGPSLARQADNGPTLNAGFVVL